MIPRLALLLAAPLLTCGLASAQFTPVAPFTGNASEGFETQDTSGGAFPVCIVDRVFGGQGDLCADNGSGGAHITTGWGFTCTMPPVEASRFFGCTSGPARYSFDTGATRFGGYFGTNASTGSALVEFFDAGGGLLHSEAITYAADCSWNWFGWDTGGAVVSSVLVTASFGGGEYCLMDGMQADLIGSAPGTEYCSCDAATTAAPCGNNGVPGNGCANSTFGAGAHLAGTGVPSLTSNSVVLHGSGLAPNQPGIYFQGNNALGGGAGMTFGDGLRCAGGNLVRLQIISADGNGNSQLTVDLVAAQPFTLSAGDTRRYQIWYHDPIGSPCGAGFNLSNGYEITWLP
jgi:hypothetical protein